MLERWLLGLLGLWEEMKEFGAKMRNNLFQNDFWKVKMVFHKNLIVLIVVQGYGKCVFGVQSVYDYYIVLYITCFVSF